MAYLKKKDLQGGTLSYRRQKTGQQLFVKWEKPMQEIVDKYNTNGTPYLLPIIRDMNADIRRQYKNAAHLVNDKLKKLGEKLGLDRSPDQLRRPPRMGIHRQEQKHSACDYQRSNGARFGEDHADLSRLFGHHLRGQGEQPNSESPVNIKGAYFGNSIQKSPSKDISLEGDALFVELSRL